MKVKGGPGRFLGWKGAGLALVAGWALLGPGLPALAEDAPSPPPRRANSDYLYYRNGNPRDAVGACQGGVALVGGGGYLDEVFRWMARRSGGGDFLVLRAVGDAEIHPYLEDLGGFDSVETLLLLTREASSDPFVLDRVRRADALWLAGGDQSRYVRRWKDTPLEDALNEAASRGVPLGGTSAGLAVLGEFSFSCRKDTITSPEALADPDDPRVTLDRDFLQAPRMGGILTDSHFSERDRMGRLVVFLAWIGRQGWSERPRAVAVDERTGVLLEPDGSSKVVGESSAFFVEAPPAPPSWEEGRPFTWRDLQVEEVPSGGAFDFPSWTGSGTRYGLSVTDGVLERGEAPAAGREPARKTSPK